MISYDYIRGLVEGEGTFTFSTNRAARRKIPAFAIKMHHRDKKLLEEIRNTLRLKNKIYIYNHQRNDGSVRAPQAMLIVRELDQLKDIIIPFFYKKLFGNKAKQFNEWIEKIWRDPDVPHSYKIIYKYHEWGRYDNDHRFDSN